MITASQIARLTAELSARNKRKNFQPRNCAGEEDGDKANEAEESEAALASDHLNSCDKATEEEEVEGHSRSKLDQGHQSPTSLSAKASPAASVVVAPSASSPPSTMAESITFSDPFISSSSTANVVNASLSTSSTHANATTTRVLLLLCLLLQRLQVEITIVQL